MAVLEDRSIQFSEAKASLSLVKKTKEDIEFVLGFDCEVLHFSHKYVWLEDDIELVLNNIKEIRTQEIDDSEISVDSPGIEFRCKKYEHQEGIYFVTISVDLGYLTSYMGTESLLSLSLSTTLPDFEEWIREGFEIK